MHLCRRLYGYFARLPGKQETIKKLAETIHYKLYTVHCTMYIVQSKEYSNMTLTMSIVCVLKARMAKQRFTVFIRYTLKNK